MLEFFIGYYLVMVGYTFGYLVCAAGRDGLEYSFTNQALLALAGIAWPIFGLMKLFDSKPRT